MPKDPAFLFYPADASEDTQFMNRLERGCYFDLLKAQKKFGKFSIDQIKKVLGKDFENCWAALELILKKENQFFFIEWANDSLEKRKLFSESRSKNRKKSTSDKDMNNISTSQDEDMVNAIENINVNKKATGNKDFGKSENLLKILVPEMVKTFKKFNKTYPADVERDSKPLQQIAKFISDAQKIPYNPRDHTCMDHILSSWEVISEFISKDNFFKSYNLILIEKHIQSIVQKIVHGQSTGTNGKAGIGKVTSEQLNKAFTDFYSQEKSP